MSWCGGGEMRPTPGVECRVCALPRLQLEESAQRREPGRLVVDEARVLLEHVVTAGACRVLQLVDRVRIEEVVLAFPSPLVLTADRQLAVRELFGTVGICNAVT